MGRENNSIYFPRVIANGIVFLLTAALLVFKDVAADSSRLTRNIVVYFANAIGLEASNARDAINIGSVTLNWDEGCSGHSALLVLLGIVAWTSYRNPTIQLALKMAAMLPLSVGVNVIRVLLISVYRLLLYPAWEGEQLHYLFGFLSVLPFVYFLSGASLRSKSLSWPELTYLLAILAVLTTELSDPGGMIVFISTVGCLFPLAMSNEPQPRRKRLFTYIWVVAGFLIAGAGAESIWLPWLLVCPRFVDKSIVSSPGGFLLLLGTIPILAAQPMIQVLVLLGLVWQMAIHFGWVHNFIGRDLHAEVASTEDAFSARRNSWVYLMIAMPFVLPIGLSGFRADLRPPSGAVQQDLGNSSYQIRIMGQPRDVVTFWYGGDQHGRHHSVRNCLRFRGVTTEPVEGSPGIIQTDALWIRECFFLDDKRVDTYASYASRCFPPLTSHGIHIVIQAKRGPIDHEFFSRESERLLNRIFDDYRQSRLRRKKR